MRAVSAYEAYVRQSLACGVDAVVVGAGLPLDLPELARDYPKAALIPILSDARGVQLVVRKWEKKGRLPDAIVIEHPRLAGGHLGAAKVADLNDRRFDFDVVLPEVLAFFRIGRPRRPHPAHRRRRHRQPRRHSAAAGPGRHGRPAGHGLRRHHRVRRPPRIQAGPGRGQAGGHGRVHQRCGPARARGAHALAGKIPAASSRA